MKYTSSEANKLLRKLNSDYQAMLDAELNSRSFLAASGEDVESVRPAYDYEATQSEIDAVAAKIRKLKHAINLFNASTVLEGFDMTIDEMLVYLPQLSSKVNKLDYMRRALPKLRENTYGSGMGATIDYRYANYDIEAASKDYEEAYRLLTEAQTALDLVNNTVTFDIEI